MVSRGNKAARYILRLLAFALLALLAVLLSSIVNFWWLLFWLLLYAIGQGI